MRENIVLGDLHSCIDEFNDLLQVINYDVKKHRIILVGDILDRGTDPIGLIHQIRDMGLDCCISNHEEKAYRWRQYEKRKELTGEENPVKDPLPDRKAEWLALTPEDLDWIASLPAMIHIKDNWHAVHGGLESAFSFTAQRRDRVIRTRYLNPDGTFVKVKNGKDAPDGAKFWAKMWNQPFNMVFGHTVFKSPKFFQNGNNTCVGIDTGAVYGGHLTAYNVDRNQILQVKARRTYYNPV